MNEFIEKLIGRLEEEKKYCSYNPKIRDEAINKAIEIVNELVEEYNGGWIPCSERLPESEHKYLICDDKGNVYTSTYYNNRWLVTIATDEVLAWQPLPEPYKKS